MVLDAETALEGLLVFKLGDGLAVEPRTDARAFGFHAEVVPFRWLEKALAGFLIRRGLLFAFGEEPATHADAVDTSGLGVGDFALVALGFALITNQSETKALIEARIFLWNFDLQFRHKIAQLQLADHPDINL